MFRSRPLLFLAYALGAAAMHLLVLEALWLAGGARTGPVGEERIAVLRLRANAPSAAEHVAVLEDEDGSRRILEHFAALRDRLELEGRREAWEGEFEMATGYGGERLVLADGHFARFLSDCTGSASEAGGVALVGGVLELRERLGPFEFPPPCSRSDLEFRQLRESMPRLLIPTPCGGAMYLIEPREMLEFADLAASGDAERWESRERFRHRRGDPVAGPQTHVVIPDGYRRLWMALPHFRVLRRIEAHGSMPVQLEIESDGSRQDPDRHETFYWDGDPSGHVRAIELSRSGSSVLAYLPKDAGVSSGRIDVGDTFSRLPNLR